MSIAGLSLDFAGAGFLAYDVLYGPQARLQASLRRTRLALAEESRERHLRHLQELTETPNTSDERMRRVRDELPALTHAIHDVSAELKHWEKHELRAQKNALVGLLLLMAGFVAQAIGAILNAA